MRTTSICFAAGLLLCCASAHAQIDKNSIEFGIFGTAIVGIEDDAPTVVITGASWGRFVTKSIQVGVTGSIIFTDDEDGDSLFGLAGPYARYNFRNDAKAMPFVGLGAWVRLEEDEFDELDDDDTGDVLLNLEIGTRFMVTEELAFSVLGSYLVDVDSGEGAPFLTIGAGFSYFFGEKN